MAIRFITPEIVPGVEPSVHSKLWSEVLNLQPDDGTEADPLQVPFRPEDDFPIPRYKLTREPMTELGNAKRFVDAFGRNVKYLASRGKHLTFDGRRWVIAPYAKMIALALQVTRGIHAKAAVLPTRQREEWQEFALSCETLHHLKAIVEGAASFPDMIIEESRLDADPMLLNCLNGTINLKTGRLRRHDRNDFLTRMPL